MVKSYDHSWLGRQPVDHSRSEREMLRVRIPPEPLGPRLVRFVCPRGAAWSAHHPVKVGIVGSNPIGGASWNSSRFIEVRWPDLGRVGWALASPGGRNPPALLGSWRFKSVPMHSVMSTHFHPFQAGGCSIGPHKADFPVRVRGLGFSRPGRQIGKAASSRGWCLWVRIPPRPLRDSPRPLVQRRGRPAYIRETGVRFPRG